MASHSLMGAYSISTLPPADVLSWAHYAFVLREDSRITCNVLLSSMVLYARVTIKLEVVEGGVHIDHLRIEK